MARIELSDRDVVGIRAPNPGPFTLSGTNSWVVGRDPAWLIDPGPDLDEHVAALVAELGRRGGLAGVALTHGHPDHAEAVGAIRERFPHAPVIAAGEDAERQASSGATTGPLTVVSTPGHAADHVAFVAGDVCFTGDAILGEGSVFISPYPGSLASYLEGLQRLRRLELRVLCPGHGPLVTAPDAKIDEYLQHRLERERRLLAALAQGKRTVSELLEDAWSDAPASLRAAAAVTLAAHLDKLEQEGRLPDGVERPAGAPLG